MSAPFGRKHLSAEGLLRTARRVFAPIPDAPGNEIALVDHLMSGLALFGLKYPSLLQFEHDRREAATRGRTSRRSTGSSVRRATRACASASMCSIRACLRPLYKALFGAVAARQGAGRVRLSRWPLSALARRHRLLLLAEGALRAVRREAPPQRHHDLLPPDARRGAGASRHKEVFPLAPEPILKPDGAKKNDCERNAAKRLLTICAASIRT